MQINPILYCQDTSTWLIIPVSLIATLPCTFLILEPFILIQICTNKQQILKNSEKELYHDYQFAIFIKSYKIECTWIFLPFSFLFLLFLELFFALYFQRQIAFWNLMPQVFIIKDDRKFRNVRVAHCYIHMYFEMYITFYGFFFPL